MNVLSLSTVRWTQTQCTEYSIWNTVLNVLDSDCTWEQWKIDDIVFLLIKHKSIFGAYNPNSKIESKSSLLIRPKRPVDGTTEHPTCIMLYAQIQYIMHVCDLSLLQHWQIRESREIIELVCISTDTFTYINPESEPQNQNQNHRYRINFLIKTVL